MESSVVKVYAITDRSWLQENETLEQKVEEAILGGATIVQLREKKVAPEQEKEIALQVQKVCRKYQIPFVINDNVELALEIGADGVHVGQSDCSVAKARELLGEEKIVGATAKTIEQAKTAEKQGADYIGSGAVFGTTTKSDAKPMELSLFQEICESVAIPVVAIGGITGENLKQLKGTNLSGVAVVGGIFAQKDCCKATQKIAEEICGILSQ